MAMTAVKVKIMPESLETNLAKIQLGIHEKLKEAKNIQIEEQEIAFGLKALIATFAWPENLDTDKIENSLAKIKGVSSVEILDYRRAFG